ncbi:MAG: ABC transporter ATP-binding protein [Firmicutes bacterium]|nr:ABC transporter ATP-binding protein [Bacillota bacterium]
MKVIEVQNLTKRYGAFTAVDNISFSVTAGEVFGFLGPNGVGKTSTIRVLTGLSRATEGSCRILGEEMTPDNKGIRGRVGVVFEEPNLYARLSGKENLQFFAAMYGVKKQRVVDLLEEFRLSETGKKPVANFSKGMKQRLLICRALLGDPDLLILDEPTSGLDLASVELIRGHIQAFAKSGKTVFMSTHSLEEADELCGRVAFMNHGRIIAEGDPAALKLRYGKEYVQLDLFLTASMEEFMDVIDTVRPVKMEQDGKFISVQMDLTHETLGHEIDRLRSVGRIVRVHSQEASLREVFKEVLGVERM